MKRWLDIIVTIVLGILVGIAMYLIILSMIPRP